MAALQEKATGGSVKETSLHFHFRHLSFFFQIWLLTVVVFFSRYRNC